MPHTVCVAVGLASKNGMPRYRMTLPLRLGKAKEGVSQEILTFHLIGKLFCCGCEETQKSRNRQDDDGS